MANKQRASGKTGAPVWAVVRPATRAAAGR
jgi:hypothetical protein